MRSSTLAFFFFLNFTLEKCIKCSTCSKIFYFFYAVKDVDLWILIQSGVWMLSSYIFYVKLFIFRIICYFIILVFNIFFILRILY
jgi:hypothetical protein